jgi:hypothetical protein
VNLVFIFTITIIYYIYRRYPTQLVLPHPNLTEIVASGPHGHSSPVIAQIRWALLGLHIFRLIRSQRVRRLRHSIMNVTKVNALTGAKESSIKAQIVLEKRLKEALSQKEASTVSRKQFVVGMMKLDFPEQ